MSLRDDLAATALQAFLSRTGADVSDFSAVAMASYAVADAMLAERAKTESFAHVSLPAQCVGMPEHQCGLQDDDAQRAVGSFADPHAWQCAGCGLRPASAPMSES